MNKDFINLEAAGVRLAELVEEVPVAVIAIVGQGAEIAVAIAKKFQVPVLAAILERNFETHEVISVEVPNSIAQGLHYVVDDAVETGHTTTAVFAALRACGYENLRLAVPVAPRDSESKLLPMTGPVTAVVRPMVRRSLAWHYEEVPNTSREQALQLIATHNATL